MRLKGALKVPYKRSGRFKFKPPTEAGKPYERVDESGKYTHSFLMRVEPGFSQRVRKLAEKLKGEWSQADILRLAFERLEEDVEGRPHKELEPAPQLHS